LQRLLNAKGAALIVDGDFGAATLAAVTAFQARAGLLANGVVDTETINALRA
jgi:peptidoglycan hydrolase-like protein with peptidoglycan-binding domain